MLDTFFGAWTERGADVSRAQFPALRHQVAYRPPTSDVEHDMGEVVAWLRLDRAVSGRRISVVTDLFKKAVLSLHQDMHGEPPSILHGHGFDGTGYDLARFIALRT